MFGAVRSTIWNAIQLITSFQDDRVDRYRRRASASLSSEVHTGAEQQDGVLMKSIDYRIDSIDTWGVYRQCLFSSSSSISNFEFFMSHHTRKHTKIS